MSLDERQLLAAADRRALAYFDATPERRVFPDAGAIAALGVFDQALPQRGQEPEQVLRQLDEVGSPATVASNGPRYFGFVIGATLPAAAAERLVLAWDQCASSFDNSPAAWRKSPGAGSAKPSACPAKVPSASAPAPPPVPWPASRPPAARCWPAWAGTSTPTA